LTHRLSAIAEQRRQTSHIKEIVGLKADPADERLWT